MLQAEFGDDSLTEFGTCRMWEDEMIKARMNEITHGSARRSSISAFVPQRND